MTKNTQAFATGGIVTKSALVLSEPGEAWLTLAQQQALLKLLKEKP